MIRLFKKLCTPVLQNSKISDLFLAISRVFCGVLLASNFGASKFGMPWSPKENNLSLFEVSDWFVTDVEAFGGIFAVAPLLFAWLAAGSEAIGGLLLALGLKTRISAFFIGCTMLGAIFLQKWGQGVWGMLPALGFLWIAMYSLVLGSGRFGLDYLISRFLKKRALLHTPLKELK